MGRFERDGKGLIQMTRIEQDNIMKNAMHMVIMMKCKMARGTMQCKQ